MPRIGVEFSFGLSQGGAYTSNNTRCPNCEKTKLCHLNHERSILLGLAIDSITAATYTSATNSYFTFCKIHHLPIDPMPKTLSYYITFQMHFISPDSVNSYLLGI